MWKKKYNRRVFFNIRLLIDSILASLITANSSKIGNIKFLIARGIQILKLSPKLQRYSRFPMQISNTFKENTHINITFWKDFILLHILKHRKRDGLIAVVDSFPINHKNTYISLNINWPEMTVFNDNRAPRKLQKIMQKSGIKSCD